jgi:hypothetical protein
MNSQAPKASWQTTASNERWNCPRCGYVKFRRLHHDGIAPCLPAASESAPIFYCLQLCFYLLACDFEVASSLLRVYSDLLLPPTVFLSLCVWLRCRFQPPPSIFRSSNASECVPFSLLVTSRRLSVDWYSLCVSTCVLKVTTVCYYSWTTTKPFM